MNERSKYIRRETIKLMYENGLQHYGGSLSCIEILIALYDHVMTKDDVFLLSKGHSCAPMYVLLREKGLNPKIEHHPHMDVANGINMTSGSLGHGLGFGIGVALAKKIKGEPGKAFILLGDGEFQEGTTYEAISIIDNYKLNNVCILVDRNIIQGSNFCSEIIDSIHKISVEYIVKRYMDGHNMNNAYLGSETNRPRLVICETTKGHGVSFMKNDPVWHSRILSESEYKQAMEELS